LWYVLFVARDAALLHRDTTLHRVPFVVLRVPRGRRRAERTGLLVHIGLGDHGEAVVTVMLRSES
jgi:hypothetical protein